MKKNIFYFLLFLIVLSCANKKVKTYNQGINVTPIPVELTEQAGTFVLNQQTVIHSFNQQVADFFAAKIRQSTGFALAVKEAGTTAKNAIVIEQVADIPVNDEGYLLTVTPELISIKAKTPQGAFYAMQTVMQLLPAEIESPTLVNDVAWTLPSVIIKDQPRFPYRGQHLDVCRHFLNADYVKKQLDVLAMFKINKFHWHLTDDQGWRIESKKFPKLNEISSKRIEGEGFEHGGYYTQEEIKEIVAYAKERFIEIIPELETPGHAVAVLTAYPEFSCTGGPFEVRNIWGVSPDVFCAGKEETFDFLAQVIEEITPLFESKYFHIGGDECPKTRWKECPHCQKRIKENKLKDEHELQSYFIQRVEKIMATHGKKIIGWDEILEGGLAPSATVMSWRGEQGGIDAANAGHDVIMTPESYCYLNWYEGDSKILPVAFGYYTPLDKVYGYNPIPANIVADKAHHILGTQGNMWTEYTYTPDLVEFQTYPSIIAVAENTWSPLERKDYKDFERRLNNQMVRLDMHKINYFIPLPEQPYGSCNLVAFTDSARLELTTVRPVKIVYTTDGSEPTAQSKEYTAPLMFKENASVKVRSILQSGKMSSVRTITFEKQTYAHAQEKVENVQMTAKTYPGKAFKVSELDGKEPKATWQIDMPQQIPYVGGARDLVDGDLRSVVVTGYINIPKDNVYYFSTECDQFWINDQLLISNEGEVKRHSRADCSIALAKGYHPIKIVRLGHIIGGWPSVWNDVHVRVRPQGEEKFVKMKEEWFK